MSQKHEPLPEGKDPEPGRTGTPPRAFLQKSVAESEQDVAHYPEPARTETVYAQSFCREYCNSDIQRLTELLASLSQTYARSRSYFFNMLNGYYFTSPANSTAGIVNTWSEIVAVLREHEKKESAKLRMVETGTYRCFKNFILERMAPDSLCKFGGITGPTGSQKSKCAMYFHRNHNHKRTVYFEAPARRSLVSFQRKLAQQYQANVGNSAPAREANIRENINSGRCIIVDNSQDLYVPHAGANQPIFNYLRELQDDTGCTIILIFTEEFYHGDLVSGEAKGYFEQFIGRMGGIDNILRLPGYAPMSDIRAIAAHYGVTSERGIKYVKDWSRSPGRIRIAFMKLARAMAIAKLAGRKTPTLQDLQEANDYRPPATEGEETQAEDGGES